MNCKSNPFFYQNFIFKTVKLNKILLNLEFEEFGNLTFEEDILLRRLKKITKETDDFIAANQSQDIYCKCQLSKKTCNMMGEIFE